MISLVFEAQISPAVLLVAMVTTTLTLVCISHRLRGIEKSKQSQATLNQLNGIIALIWAHLIITIAISFRIMLIAFCAGQSFLFLIRQSLLLFL